MNTTLNVSKNNRRAMNVNIIVGIILLVTGILLNTLNIHVINNKAIIGLSFIPFAIAFSKWINIYFIKKYPEEMRSAIVSENDERLIKERNEAEALSNKIIRWLIMLIFIGYTFVVPEDIFKSVGWWSVLALLCVANVLPLIILRINVGSNN